MAEEKKAKLIADVLPAYHLRIKRAALDRGCTMAQLIVAALNEFLGKAKR